MLIAIAIDLALGEPHRTVHPVVWMGKVVSTLEKGGGSKSHISQFLYGMMMTLATMSLFAVPVYFLLSYLDGLSPAAYVAAGAILLKPAFSIRELRRAALKVKRLLQEEKLADARFELRALVSRDTSGLPEPLLVSAAVESVAEGTCDSFVAPLFYFLLFGVPGAIAYRVANTMDAMIGYHGKYEYLGKFASRLDDVLNFIPARMTALLLVLAASISRRKGRASWQAALSGHSRTESPNAGWPMAAMAGALDVQLEKVGQYRLGKTKNPLVAETITDSLRLAQVAILAWILICFTVEVTRFAVAA